MSGRPYRAGRGAGRREVGVDEAGEHGLAEPGTAASSSSAAASSSSSAAAASASAAAAAASASAAATAAAAAASEFHRRRPRLPPAEVAAITVRQPAADHPSPISTSAAASAAVALASIQALLQPRDTAGGNAHNPTNRVSHPRVPPSPGSPRLRCVCRNPNSQPRRRENNQ